MDTAAELPDPVLALLARLDAQQQRSWLVGESLHDLRLGLPVEVWEVATPASLADLFAAFPRGVLLDARRGIVMVPTAAGPVELATLRFGPSLSDDLAHRDFTLLAQALDPLSGDLHDPYAGERDRESRRLRCVGNAKERLREDPLRALRAARLVAERSYRVDPELAEAMREIAPQLAATPLHRLRRELRRLLLADGCREGLELLRQTGIEAALVEGVRGDAAAVTAAMPAELPIRLAAWLRGAEAAAFLRRLRFGMPLSPEVLLRLQHHPIERAVRPSNDPAVRRLLRRLDDEVLEQLFALREAELPPRKPGDEGGEAERRLGALRAAIERVRGLAEQTRRRETLALGGREVMQALGCESGRRVGQALRFLGEQVDEDPACNEPDRLRALLLQWCRAHPE
jgi:tRNA nucleotidyltransferase (CCA-adding enzyme)